MDIVGAWSHAFRAIPQNGSSSIVTVFPCTVSCVLQYSGQTGRMAIPQISGRDCHMFRGYSFSGYISRTDRHCCCGMLSPQVNHTLCLRTPLLKHLIFTQFNLTNRLINNIIKCRAWLCLYCYRGAGLVTTIIIQCTTPLT